MIKKSAVLILIQAYVYIYRFIRKIILIGVGIGVTWLMLFGGEGGTDRGCLESS